MDEIKKAEEVEQGLSILLGKYDNTPLDETSLERYSQQFYEPITLQIQSFLQLHGGHILAKKVFNNMNTENVVSLVKHMLIHKEHHSALYQLHHAFDNVYWNRRLEVEKTTCPTWDVITIPNRYNIGLIQFVQLCLRRINILQRKAPVIETERKLEIYRRPVGIGAMFHNYNISFVGNRYFLHGAGSKLYVAEIRRAGAYVPIISAVATVVTSRAHNTSFTLAEPFLIRHTREHMEAGFIPSGPDPIFSEPVPFECCLQPEIINPGNFIESKMRFHPVITIDRNDENERNERNDANEVFKFKLFKITAHDDQVNITEVWQLVLLAPEGDVQFFVANREYCAFVLGRTIYHVQFETTPKWKSIKMDVRDHLTDILRMYLVQDVIFYITNSATKDSFFSLIKINFDTMKEQFICDYESPHNIWDMDNGGDIIGRNLYRRSNENSPVVGNIIARMVYLDQNIEMNHQERETVVGSVRLANSPHQPHGITLSGHLEGTSVYPTRYLPEAGSYCIDVLQKSGGVRFQVYMDDETLLQSEITQCLLRD